MQQINPIKSDSSKKNNSDNSQKVSIKSSFKSDYKIQAIPLA